MNEIEHWVLKHMGDITWVAKCCTDIPGLNNVQRDAMELARSVARSLAARTRNCNDDSIATAVTLLCSACKACFAEDASMRCGGRRDWRDSCRLIANHVRAASTA